MNALTGRTWLTTLVLLAIAGCGSDPSPATLVLLVPEADAVLTMDDDEDPDEPGLQITVEGEAEGVNEGTQVDLYVVLDEEDGPQRQTLSGTLDAEGRVALPGTTLPPGTHRIFLRTGTGSLNSDEEQLYTLRALEITSPLDGTVLRLGDDEDLDLDGVQVSVSVRGHAVDPSEDIALLVDGDDASVTPTSSADGLSVFEKVTLPGGEHVLEAVTGSGDDELRSEPVTVEVRDVCAEIDFVSPNVPASGDALVLGGEGSCPADSGGAFEISVEISTDAGNGRPVKLSVNDIEVASGTVSGATATFDGIALPNLTSPNRLKVEVQNAEGVWCPEEFPADLVVDCAGPDCTIVSPTPVEYLDADDALTLYLNAGHERDGDFTIDVATDAAGQSVTLIVDGKTRDAPEADARDRGGDVSARFGIPLSEGSHTIEARCEDAEGNPTYTGEVTWVVDTVACDVAVTAPADNTAFVPADDDDANAANGTQVVLTSTVGGNDCIAQRAAPCDPSNGIDNPAFAFYDGVSPLLSSVTLDATSVAQTLCVEIEDRAENVGRGTLGVRYLSTPPSVSIETPDDGESFNALGNGGYSPDADPSSPVSCDAVFSVACTEIGEVVDLRHDSETGLVFESSTCAAPGTGDPPLPTGYAGRAEVTAFFSDGDDTAVIVATQTIVGTTGAELIGFSTPITVHGDCFAPTPSLLGDPCQGGFIEGPGGNVIVPEIEVLAGAIDVIGMTLEVSNTDGTTSSDDTPDDVTGNVYRFDSVDLGDEGMLTLTATSIDDFENEGVAECTADIVSDVPTLSVSAPVDDEVFGIGAGCDAGGMYGVQVTAMTDTDVNRSASISVASGGNPGVPVVPAPTVGGGGTISACVAVPDGLVTITVRVDSDITSAYREVSVDVVVASSAPSTEITLTPSCPDAGSATYRDDPLHLDWPTLGSLEDWPGQFASYVLRCAHTPASDASSATDWWDNVASDVALGDPVVVPSSGTTEADVPFRVGETRHCALRAVDPAGELTPITDSVDVSCGFREVVLFTSTTDLTSVGVDATAVGDVSGDGIDDLLVGGNGRAYLFFGRTDAFPGTPDVTFSAVAAMGNRVAALGDFNDDGRPDFAIAWQNHNGRRGQVFVFFGRPASDPWPSSVNLTVTCGADLCFKHLAVDSRLGNSIAGIGDFDGDGVPDLAAAATAYPALSNTGRLYVVRGMGYESRSCAADGDCRAGTETCDVATTGTCELVSADFWGLDYELPSGNWLNAPSGTPTTLSGFLMDGDAASDFFGNGLAPLGAFDTTGGEDLAVSAPGSGEVFFLSGHPYTETSGFETLAYARLGFRDMMDGTPDATPFATGTPSLGVPIATAGNVYDVPGGANPNALDLLVKRATDQHFYLYPGDNDFDQADRIQIDGTTSSDLGIRLCSGFHPALASLTADLDGDGYEDLCAGGSRVSAVPPGSVHLWYADVVASEGGDGLMSHTDGARIDPPTATGTGERVVRYAGDVTDDGHADIVVGDWEAAPSGSLRGQATLLY